MTGLVLVLTVLVTFNFFAPNWSIWHIKWLWQSVSLQLIHCYICIFGFMTL